MGGFRFGLSIDFFVDVSSSLSSSSWQVRCNHGIEEEVDGAVSDTENSTFILKKDEKRSQEKAQLVILWVVPMKRTSATCVAWVVLAVAHDRYVDHSFAIAVFCPVQRSTVDLSGWGSVLGWWNSFHWSTLLAVPCLKMWSREWVNGSVALTSWLVHIVVDWNAFRS